MHWSNPQLFAVACFAPASLLALGASPVPARETTLFRVNQLELRDPHVFAFACFDATAQLNQVAYDSLTQDSDGDGFLDASVVLAFRPLDQSAGCGGMTPSNGLCTAPESSTTCEVDPTSAPSSVAYTNLKVGSCLGALPGTTTGYVPAVTETASPCFLTDEFAFEFTLGGIAIPLQHVRAAGTYVGNPATVINDGLIRGFLSEADADATIIPPMVPLVGGQPVSAVLAGRTGICTAGDDRDFGPDGVTTGWWFYVNFTAEVVPFACDDPTDLDGDCDTDLADFESFHPCPSGPAVGPPECNCVPTDFDANGHSDLNDYAIFQTSFTGP